jgi:hypothetical protein
MKLSILLRKNLLAVGISLAGLLLFTNVVLTQDEPTTGRIIVDVTSNPAGSEYMFGFDAIGGSYADFSLSHDSPPNEQELAPGTYSIYEIESDDWYSDSQTCVSSFGDYEEFFYIELDAGETVTCSFNYLQQFPLTLSLDLGTRWLQVYEWAINKEVSPASADTSSGETVYFDYEITVDHVFSYEDYRIEGTVFVYNPNPTSRIFMISAVIGGSTTATVTCFDFTGEQTYIVPAGTTSECFFDLRGLNGPEYVGQEVVVTAETFDVPPYKISTTSGVVEWSNEPIRVDPSFEQVTVLDDAQDPFFDSTWLGASPGASFLNQQSYTCPTDLSLYTNGQYSLSISNTATIDETDTSDTVSVTINCFSSVGEEQCTYGQGYWRNHSEQGNAPYDDAWLSISGNGANATFFLSGSSYYEVMSTAPVGNAYYHLARQYIAAKLNILNGAASTPGVDAAIVWAETEFFSLYTPSDAPRDLHDEARAYAGTLDDYNSGLIGPGQCSE